MLRQLGRTCLAALCVCAFSSAPARAAGDRERIQQIVNDLKTRLGIAQTVNVMLVETNYAQNGRVDPTVYDHFSLLRTLQAGFGLPCLNHSCDPTSKVMNVMFGGH